MRGRPRKEEPCRDYHLSVRVAESDINMVEFLCERLDVSPSEVVRKAIRMLYAKEKFGI